MSRPNWFTSAGARWIIHAAFTIAQRDTWVLKIQYAVAETYGEERAISGLGADFHGLIDGVIRAARNRGRAARDHVKAFSGGFDLVCVTVAS